MTDVTPQAKVDAIKAIINATSMEALHPGYIGPPIKVGPWWREPGVPYKEGENAADQPERAKELAAQFLRVNGAPSGIAVQDRTVILELCDFIGADTTTAQQAEAKMIGAGTSDSDAAIYEIILGQFTNAYPAGLGGTPKLMYPSVKFADVIHQPGKPVGGNVAG